MADVVVKTEKVVKEYRMGTNVLRALDGIDWRFIPESIFLDGTVWLRQIDLV